MSVDRDESIAKPNEQHEVDFSIYNPYLEEKAKATTVLNPITASEQQQSQQAVTAEGAPHLPGGDVRETAGTGERLAGADKRLMIDSQNTAEDNSMVAYRNIQLLLGIGIATTALALAGSIYGLLQSSVGFSGKLGIISVGLLFIKPLPRFLMFLAVYLTTGSNDVRASAL